MDLATPAKARVPVLLWGPPGIGNTYRWIRLGRDLKRPIHVLIASIRNPTDFCGFPCPNAQRGCVD